MALPKMDIANSLENWKERWDKLIIPQKVGTFEQTKALFLYVGYFS